MTLFRELLSVMLWVSINIYFIRNRRAVARVLRGYGAYDVWKAKDWVKQWNDYDLTGIDQTCDVYRLRGGKNVENKARQTAGR